MEQTTIKALASEIGVSKVAVSKKIESLGLKGELIADGKRFLVPPTVAEKVIESYRTRTEEMKGKTSAAEDKPKRAEENPDFSDIIEMLKEQNEYLKQQLEEKDRLLKDQLAENNRQVERFQLLLNQQQQLMLNQPNGAVVDAEEVSGHEESTSVVADVSDSDPDRKEPKRGIFSRFFR